MELHGDLIRSGLTFPSENILAARNAVVESVLFAWKVLLLFRAQWLESCLYILEGTREGWVSASLRVFYCFQSIGARGFTFAGYIFRSCLVVFYLFSSLKVKLWPVRHWTGDRAQDDEGRMWVTLHCQLLFLIFDVKYVLRKSGFLI